jgi:hypothetical protein
MEKISSLEEAGNQRLSWYTEGEQVRTTDRMIDWLRELWKLHEVFEADPVTAKLLAT